MKEADKNIADDDSKETHLGPKLGFLLNDLSKMITQIWDSRMKYADLTRSQWRAIGHVSRSPGITQIELAEALGVGRMAVTGIIDRLERKKLLIRKADSSDRRVKKVYVTEKAKKLLPSMKDVGDSVIQDMTDGLSDRQLQQLISGLTKMYE
ncbi:MAG: MarR family transcriptional regulator, partial [Pseudomonadales bacterium]|nr:MarR family transcriptional regulator [Pseudomonadales bacterium]